MLMPLETESVMLPQKELSRALLVVLRQQANKGEPGEGREGLTQGHPPNSAPVISAIFDFQSAGQVLSTVHKSHHSLATPCTFN